MAARRHLCCYINDETHEGCDEVATRALGYYNPNVAPLYACDIHKGWLPTQWNRASDPIYFSLDDGFDPMQDTQREIALAKARLEAANGR